MVTGKAAHKDITIFFFYYFTESRYVSVTSLSNSLNYIQLLYFLLQDIIYNEWTKSVIVVS
jgi:hypothetical protein